MARNHRPLQQVERAGDVNFDEGLRGRPDNVRLMQRTSVDDRIDAMIREGAFHHCPIGDRADNMRIAARHNVEAGDCMTGRAETRCQESTEPPRRAGEENKRYPRCTLAAAQIQLAPERS